MKYPTGSVISNTHDTGELLQAFASELLRLAPENSAIPYYPLIQEAKGTSGDDPGAQDVVDELIAALNDYAAPYFYFGAHPNDGADFGFWLDEEGLRQFDGLKVSDTSEVPATYCGEVMHVNDHGNVTLYFAQSGQELQEVWAVV